MDSIGNRVEKCTFFGVNLAKFDVRRMLRGMSGKRMSVSDRELSRDMRLLGWIFRQTVLADEGAETWDLFRQLRSQGQAHEDGDQDAAARMLARLETLSARSMAVQLRLLGVWFDLANLAEDLHRERVLDERRAARNLRQTFADVQKRCLAHAPAEVVDTMWSNLKADFVLTAHPTEAKRQAIRRNLRRLRHELRALVQPGLPRPERRTRIDAAHEEVRALWRTDALHPHSPTVLEELGRGIYALQSIWRGLPHVLADVDTQTYPLPLTFGCWIGGDRDGHPHVTCETTRETLHRLRKAVLTLHIEEADDFVKRLTYNISNPETRGFLVPLIEKKNLLLPGDRNELERLHPKELFRQAITVVAGRLRRARIEPASYTAEEFAEDLESVHAALLKDHLSGSWVSRLEGWRNRARVFGFHFAKLDVRQNRKVLREIFAEVTRAIQDLCGVTLRSELDLLGWDGPFPGWPELGARISSERRDLLDVMALYHRETEEGRGSALGAWIVSMTHEASDLWLLAGLVRLVGQGLAPVSDAQFPLVPLFETIEDLQHADEVLDELFGNPQYRELVRAQGDRQLCMIGYSDSSKDGGYTAACWALFEAQEQMAAAAAKHDVQLTFFHGRGGALGRGGGPAARAIRSLPHAALRGRIRMTEQGEVLAERFDDHRIARRHIEQVLSALMEEGIAEARQIPDAWRTCVGRMSDVSRQAYLDLIEDDGFMDYFQQATPIRSVERLAIGSRPSRRSGLQSLEDLRAIPYTFSWTQSRQLLNAFYGLGLAWSRLSDEEKELTKQLYQEWSFFTSMIDNAELALAKCDPGMVRHYAAMVEPAETGQRIGDLVCMEIERTKEAVLAMTGRDALLSCTPWLQRSVKRRNPIVDICNLAQIECLRRSKTTPEGDKELDHCLRLSVQGLAAGLRTTG